MGKRRAEHVGSNERLDSGDSSSVVPPVSAPPRWTSTLSSVVPGLRPGAPKWNAIVVLAYVVLFLLLLSQFSVLLGIR